MSAPLPLAQLSLTQPDLLIGAHSYSALEPRFSAMRASGLVEPGARRHSVHRDPAGRARPLARWLPRCASSPATSAPQSLGCGARYLAVRPFPQVRFAVPCLTL